MSTTLAIVLLLLFAVVGGVALAAYLVADARRFHQELEEDARRHREVMDAAARALQESRRDRSVN